jgi:hypothetical protein
MQTPIEAPSLRRLHLDGVSSRACQWIWALCRHSHLLRLLVVISSGRPFSGRSAPGRTRTCDPLLRRHIGACLLPAVIHEPPGQGTHRNHIRVIQRHPAPGRVLPPYCLDSGGGYSGNPMEGWTLAAVAALLLSAIVFLKQFPLQRRVTEIEEARRQEEVASRLVADVAAAIEHEARPGSALSQSTYLVLHNRGPAVAADTDIEAGAEGWSVMKDAAPLPVTLDAGRGTASPSTWSTTQPPHSTSRSGGEMGPGHRPRGSRRLGDWCGSARVRHPRTSRPDRHRAGRERRYLMRPDELERRLRERLDALGPAPRAELLHVLMLPDFERADRIGEFWGNPKTRTFAELLIDCEEDRTLVLVGTLRESEGR